MVTSARYCDLVRERRDTYNHRLQLVESAKQRGIKPTAQLFTTSPLTVRKGWRRYPQHGPSGLQEHSRAPHRHPLKTSADVERKGDFPKAPGDSQHVRIPPAAQHLSERRGNGSSPGGRRVLRPRRVPNSWRVPRQSAHLAAVLQPRTAQLAERKSQPLANHRAARSPLTPRILLASACLPGLLPQRLRGYDVPRLP